MGASITITKVTEGSAFTEGGCVYEVGKNYMTNSRTGCHYRQESKNN